jgi:hypothetical protein
VAVARVVTPKVGLLFQPVALLVQVVLVARLRLVSVAAFHLSGCLSLVAVLVVLALAA